LGTGVAHDIVRGVSVAALFYWAADEVIRGVNPFRRLLGAVVAVFLAISLAR